MSDDKDWNPPGFDCTNCGKCCSNFSDDRGVMLTREDVVRISEFFGLTKSEFAKRDVEFILYGPPGKADFAMILKSRGPKCIYLDDMDHCRVHEVKPEQCARGPFGVYYPTAVADDYDCLEGLEIPEGWDTRAHDAELIARCLYQTQDEMLRFLTDQDDSSVP